MLQVIPSCSFNITKKFHNKQETSPLYNSSTTTEGTYLSTARGKRTQQCVTLLNATYPTVDWNNAAEGKHPYAQALIKEIC